jgi:hypothetical protein
MNQFGCTWLYSYVMWVKYNLLSIRLEIVLTSTQDSWMVCMERPIGSKIILGTPDGTPRRCGSVECHSIYLVMVLISALDRCTACTECTTDTESFWLHSVDLQDDVGKMEAHFGLFWDMLISTQDRCTVHVEHAIGSEFVLGTPDGTPGDVDQVEGRLIRLDRVSNSARRCTVCVECTMGKEIVLGVPDGTTR